MKANQDIRDALKDAGLYQWQLAEEIGTFEGTLSRWLRRELPPKEKERMKRAIEKLKGEVSV